MISFVPDHEFTVAGRGLVFTANRKLQPEIENIKVGTTVVCNSKTYLIRSIEKMMKLCYPPKPGDEIAFVVREVEL